MVLFQRSCRGERTFQKIIPQCELTNPSMQLRQINRCRSISTAKKINRTLAQLLLPIGNLVRMQLELLAKFRKSSAFT